MFLVFEVKIRCSILVMTAYLWGNAMFIWFNLCLVS